jgi:hypothetical protein
MGFDPIFYLNVISDDERDPLIPPFRMGEYGYWVTTPWRVAVGGAS